MRAGLADQLHDVFVLGLPIMVVVFFATLAIRPIPLRETVDTPEEAQREYLDTMAQSAPSRGYVPSLREGDVGARTRERVLGLQLAMLARQVLHEVWGYSAFRGPQAQANQLRKLSRLVSQLRRFAPSLSPGGPVRAG